MILLLLIGLVAIVFGVFWVMNQPWSINGPGK